MVIEVKDTDSEMRAIFDFKSQIKRWFEDHKVKRYNSILLNKIIYYSKKELGIPLSSGWYKYGPVIADSLDKEGFDDGLVIFERVQAAKEIDEAVDSVCTELVPRFQEDKYSDGAFGFLDYVYRNKCDRDEIKQYYPAKNDLLRVLYDWTKSDGKNLALVEKTLLKFDKSLLSDEFKEFISLSEKDIELLNQYTLSMHGKLIEQHENGEDSKDFCRHLIVNFGKYALQPISYKIYLATAVSFNKMQKRRMQLRAKSGYTNTTKNLNLLLDSMVLWG